MRRITYVKPNNTDVRIGPNLNYQTVFDCILAEVQSVTSRGQDLGNQQQ